MALDDSRKVTDARALRALAHPIRISLIEALGRCGPLTATEAGEQIGETPTMCSFHLRQLAKYGFVEEAGSGPGRKRPWRLTQVALTFANRSDDAEFSVAVDHLEGLLLARQSARIEHWRRTRAAYPEAWQDLAGLNDLLLYATAEEAKAFADDLVAMVGKFQERLTDQTKRPKGALPLAVFAYLIPLEPPAAEG